MRKSFLTVVSLIVLVLSLGPLAHSQTPRAAEREAEWNQYVLPQTTFVRQTDSNKVVLFQVPSEWKLQQSDKLSFTGPHGVNLTVFVEKIPDGMPLRDFVSALLQPLRSLPDGADSMVVRRTTMSALEAREILFETNASSEELSRRIIWSTVSGPNAISLVLVLPVANVAELEPYFKAVVQSVTLLDKDDYEGFEALRSSIIKDTGPIRVDEVQSLAASLAILNGSDRQSIIHKLATIFRSSPDTVVDLLLDARSMVRSAAYEAIGLSGNSSLEKLLLRALNDREPFVAEQAARSLAANPKVIHLLRDHSLGWFHVQPVARVWPFLSRNNQVKILEEIFAQRLVPPSADTSLKLKSPEVTVRATVLPPGTPPPNVMQGVPVTSNPKRHFNALTLMRDLPATEFKLPFASLVAAKNDDLTILALQIAWWRHELLPATDLIKLLSSDNSEVRRLAGLNLGQSGSVADIKSIEDYLKPAISTSTKHGVAAETGKPKDSDAFFADDLQLTITKIRLREKLATVSGEARQQLIKKSLADPKLVEWVWYRFVRENGDGSQSAGEVKSSPAHQIKVLPLGENLFPENVTYYAAIPQPEKALDKLGGALEGLQLDSARSQANFVLILNSLREQLARQLDSPPGSPPIAHSGINNKEPIALANWYAEGAPHGIQSAERKAIILRVTDRARFERTLALYQQSIGNFRGLSDYFSGGVRFMTVLPAFLPLTAKAMLDGSITPPKETPFLRYNFVGGTEWNGYSIKRVEQRQVAATGHMTTDAAYLVYLGDTALLAPDLDSLRDVLSRASSEQPTLANNSNFKRLVGDARENGGEAIYLSNLTQLFADPTESEMSPGKAVVTESGSLRVSNSKWENLFQLKFTRSDWLKPFIGFQPEQLESPKELLPRTTIAYYFMNFDAVAVWHDWSNGMFSAEERKDMASIWGLDFEKEILPELGPECGLAIMGLPNVLGDKWEVPVVAFFKLKSDKLERALQSGKLLTGSSAGAGPIQFKLKSSDLFAMVKGNFLVLANSKQAIAALDHKEKLISSRHFSRAAKEVPSGVMAFGGYNLEAAVSAIGDPGADPIKSLKFSFVSSLTNAFHSPNFYAVATPDAVQGHFSLSMDREGRFSVSELASLSKDYRLSYAQIDPHGVPIQNQDRLSSLKLRVKAAAAGEIDRIKEDVSSTYQTAEKISDRELVLRVLPRHFELKTSLELPIKGAEFVPYLQAGNEIRSDDSSVTEKSREIAGTERDAWKVATKLADWTYKNIKWKQVDYATAPQTLATLEADCLEFSQLYVAMARSLGLPARIVSGVAYAGAAFGGHAWVEVYVGAWIEVDPTWGTDYVDATHIRDSGSGALLTYAALNLLELEVLEAPRGIEDFQKDPRSLVETLCRDLPKGDRTTVSSALDLALLTDENGGPGTWGSLSDSEREVMSSAYHRVLAEIIDGFREETDSPSELRLLKLKQDGEVAEALVLEPGFDGLLLKFSLAHRSGAWFLTDILQVDTGLHIISETLQPTIKSIVEHRKNNAARSRSTSDFVRVLLIMENDPKAAITIADRVLKDDDKNQPLRYLKALALMKSEREEDGIELLKVLAGEAKPFAAALLGLARYYDRSDDQPKQKLAIEAYLRYGEVEPEDPRTHVSLARLYDNSGDYVRAEAEHRLALKSDPSNTDQFVDFAAFLVIKKRLSEAASVIEEADKKATAGDDLFGSLMTQLYFADEKAVAEELARTQPQRMEKSAIANYYLGYLRFNDEKTLEAIILFKKAASLKSDWADPHGAMARSYRKLRSWRAALNSADTAIKMQADYSEAHYTRACVLARLGRINEALESLAKAVELDPDWSEEIAEEPDLKVLTSRPAFKKLLPVPEPKQ